MSEIGFKAACLGDIADFEMGQAPPGRECNKDGVGTVFVKTGEFGELFPEKKEWTTKPLKFGKDGDVFICVVGATCGKLNLGIDCAIGRSVAAIRPKDGVETRFIYYQLMPWVLKLRASSSGSAQGVISKNQLKEVPVVSAPPEQQKRIVAEIEKQFSRLDEAVANLKRVKANLKRYKAAVLKAAVEGKLTEEWRKQHPDVEPADKLLERILAERREKWQGRGKYKEPADIDKSDLSNLSYNWLWTSLESVADIIDPNPSHRMPKYVDRGVPFISTENFQGSEEIDFTIGKQVSEEVLKDQRAKFVIAEGDFVLTRIGTIGKTRFLPADRDYCLSHALVVIKTYSDEIDSKFLRYVVASDAILEQAKTGVQSVGVPDLGMGKIRSFRIPLMSLQEQCEIVIAIEQKLSIITVVESGIDRELNRAKRLRQSILKKAFSGKLIS